MALPWYAIPVIFLFSLIALNVFLLLLFKLLRNPESCCSTKPPDTDGEIEKATLADKEEQYEKGTGKERIGDDHHFSEKRAESPKSEVSYAESELSLAKKSGRKRRDKKLVTVVVDNTADSSLSGDEEEPYEPSVSGVLTPISAYGDTSANESNIHLSSTLIEGDYLRIHLSLIFSTERRYVAGKISQIEGVIRNEIPVADQVKVHVVYLPLKKYILRTKYYKINPLANNCRVDEYFKMKFRKTPEISTSMLRLRVYGKKVRAFTSKEKCLGEAKINFTEFATIRGGITLRRNVLPFA